MIMYENKREMIIIDMGIAHVVNFISRIKIVASY